MGCGVGRAVGCVGLFASPPQVQVRDFKMKYWNLKVYLSQAVCKRLLYGLGEMEVVT